MIPKFQVPTSVSLPDALPIPNIPYTLPSLEMPRWTPIVTPLPEQQRMEPPVVKPQDEVIEEKPRQERKPTVEPKQEPRTEPVIQPPVTEEAPPPEPVVTVETETPLVIELPIIGEIPVPSKELLVNTGLTAAIAASVSVVAALSATTLINYLMKLFKPLMKFILKRILKRKNKYTISWARQRRSEKLLRQRK